MLVKWRLRNRELQNYLKLKRKDYEIIYPNFKVSVRAMSFYNTTFYLLSYSFSCN